MFELFAVCVLANHVKISFPDRFDVTRRLISDSVVVVRDAKTVSAPFPRYL